MQVPIPVLNAEITVSAATSLKTSILRICQAYQLRNLQVHPDTWQPIIARLLQIASLSDDDDDDVEESVFWLFTALTETLLPLDYFQLQTVGALIDTKLIQQLLAVRMPDLSRHLGTLKFSFTRVEEWLRSLFAGEARFDTLCRIWDLLFARGHVGLI